MALDESILEYFSPCLLEFGSDQVSFFFSLKKFQEQLQSAGSDVSAQLQQNFDAQVSALKAEHQVYYYISTLFETLQLVSMDDLLDFYCSRMS